MTQDSISMKTKLNLNTKTGASLRLAFAKASGFQVRVRKQRDAVHQRFPSRNNGHRKLIDLALNEAEALAWQTPFPYLVFPTLAEEKTETLARWRAKQENLRRTHSPVD
jgi:hypothetical protein